jgi:hypothetical protein
MLPAPARSQRQPRQPSAHIRLLGSDENSWTARSFCKGVEPISIDAQMDVPNMYVHEPVSPIGNASVQCLALIRCTAIQLKRAGSAAHQSPQHEQRQRAHRRAP